MTKAKKRKRKNKSKAFQIEFKDAFGGTHSFNPDELWRADLTSVNDVYYNLRLFDKSDGLICEAPATYELWQKLDLGKIIEKDRSMQPKKYRTTMVSFSDITKKACRQPLSELKSITEEIDHGKPKFKVEFNTGSQFYVNKENFDFFVKMFEEKLAAKDEFIFFN